MLFITLNYVIYCIAVINARLAKLLGIIQITRILSLLRVMAGAGHPVRVCVQNNLASQNASVIVKARQRNISF